ncbi:hypothetical protein [Agromyces sp. LHK192]|uniref:hypothetical protein n=1 Tax=Agromyces sp. LHK192 TaxID=2498704 RepID=UPI001F0C7E98|nr:hypothetical protein [Agromyces sp. LHK192]
MTTDATNPDDDQVPEDDQVRGDDQVSDDELDEPSTEKEPGSEPRAEQPDDPHADHHAVGIGIVDASLPGEAEDDPDSA